MADVKELSINNTTYDIKAKSVVDQNSGSVKMWTGTRTQYDAIVTKDPHTLYNVTGVETDADQIITELANKTNISFDNVTNEAKVLMSGMGMPSNKYIDLTLGATGTTYTAPANGFFDLRKGGNAGQFGRMNSGRLETGDTLGNISVVSLFLPVKKGDVITVLYDLTNTTYTFRFIYAQGSESEAN